MGLEVKTSGEFDRNGAIDGLGAFTVIDGIRQTGGNVLDPRAPDGGTLVGRL
jgi:hypothetical protein